MTKLTSRNHIVKAKTKMGLDPLVLTLKGPGLKTVQLSQLARLQKEYQPASLVNIQRLKKPELSTVKLTAIAVGQEKERREKFHSERPRLGSDSPKSSDSVSGSSGSDQEQTCSSEYNSDNGNDHSDSSPSGYHSSSSSGSRSGSSSRSSSTPGSRL